MLGDQVFPGQSETIAETGAGERTQENQGLPILVGCRLHQLVNLVEGEDFPLGRGRLGQLDRWDWILVDVSVAFGPTEGSANGFDVHDGGLGSRPLIHPFVEEDFDVPGLDASERLVGDLPEALQKEAGGVAVPLDGCGSIRPGEIAQPLLKILADGHRGQGLADHLLRDVAHDLLEGRDAGVALTGGLLGVFPFQGHPGGGGAVGSLGRFADGLAVPVGVAGEPERGPVALENGGHRNAPQDAPSLCSKVGRLPTKTSHFPCRNANEYALLKRCIVTRVRFPSPAPFTIKHLRRCASKVQVNHRG